MFAPQPIPQSVREMYERAIFLANRIDCQLTVGALVMIAASATKTSTTSVSEPIEPEVVEIPATLPVQTDIGLQVTDAQTPVQTQTGGNPPNATPQDEHGPAGLMDAPIPPAVTKPEDLLKTLQNMDKKELIAHATGVCGIPVSEVLNRVSGKKGRPTKYEINRTTIDSIIKKILGKQNG